MHSYATYLELALAVPTAAALFFITAPYGRHARAGWGPTMPARWGWVLMESPAVLLFAAIYSMGSQRGEVVPLVMLALWQLHYVHRTFIFPFRLPAGAKRIPVSVVVMAVGFNVLNAYVNAHWISELGSYPLEWLGDGRFIAGTLLFLAGWSVNIWSDTILLRLKARGGGYQIPRGGLYRWISAPNYAGEVFEWMGWAVLTWSLAGTAFAVFAAANLVPRAVAHHRWYRETFADYPAERRAWLPFVW